MKKLVALFLAALMMAAMLAVMPAGAEEYVKLTWAQGTSADAPKDAAEVAEALNQITREKLGCEVDILYFTGDQIRTSVQAGEVYDMYFTCDWHNDYVTNSFNGIFADITELVKTVTPDLYATMPEEVWELAKVGGKLYGIPVKKDYCPEIFVMFNKEFYAEKGMEIPAKMDFVDLEPYLKAYKEAYPDKYPLIMSRSPSGIDGTFNYVNRDARIGFPYSAAGTENATKIICMYEDEEMIKRFTALHDWYVKGYINPDAATTEVAGIDNKIDFLKFGQGFYGADAIWSSSYQYPIQISKISGPYLSTSGARGSLNAFSSALEKDPERLELCLKYQELVNTDKTYRDILRYGIEGKHFSYKEDGTVEKSQAGIDNYSPWAFSQGSYALASVEASQFEAVPADPNMWEVVFDGYKDAIVAADYGFSFDPSGFDMEVSQLIVINDKWYGQIFTGTVDPAEALPQIIAEMEAAGLRDVIAAAQEQLDAHLANLP